MKFIKCSFLEFTFRNMSNLQCLFHEITFLLQFKSQYWSNSFHRTENVRRIQTIRCSCGSLCYGWNKQHCIFCIIHYIEHFQTTTNISSDFSNFKSSPTNNRFYRKMHEKKNCRCLTKSYLTCGRKRVMTGQIKYYKRLSIWSWDLHNN